MEIIAALNKYSKGAGDEKDLVVIFSFCKKAAVRHLHSLERSSKHKIFRQSGSDNIQDQAANYIAQLWCPPGENGLAPIARIWQTLLAKTNQIPEDALAYLSNTIKGIVWKQRIEDLRKSRPQEWKLRRSIRLITNRSDDLGIIRTAGQLLITRKINLDSDLSCVSEKTFERHCYRLFEGTDSITDMVIKASKILYVSVIPGNAIRFEWLATIITKFTANIMSSGSFSASFNKGAEDRIHLNSILEPVFAKITNKIKTSYVDKGKLSPAMAEIYMHGLQLFMNDLLEVGTTEKQYIYLADKIPGLNSKAFNLTHKAKFGYLVVELKAILHEHVSSLLHPDQSWKKQA